MAVARMLFDILSYERAVKIRPPQKNDTMSHPPCSVLARKFNVAHKNRHLLSYDSPILILKTVSDLWDNSRQDDMRIIEIRQKLIEQEPIFGFELWKRCQPSCSGLSKILDIKSKLWDNSRWNDVQIVKICQKIKWWRCFCVRLWVHNIEYTKTLLSLYFWTNFTNLHTLLTRIVSQFRFFIQNQNLPTAAQLASFSKYETKICFCLAIFCRISKISVSFWRELSQESEPVFKIRIGISQLKGQRF